MGATNSKWRGNQLAFYDGSTHETVLPLAPIVFFDDFRGAAYDSNIWLYNDANEATQALSADASGVHDVVLALAANETQQEAGLGWQGNALGWDISKGLIVEFRMKLTVLPTLVAEAHIGVLGEALVDDQQISSADDYAEHCVFSFDGNGVAIINADDGTNETTAAATGITVVNTAYHIYRIDFTDDSNVRFYIDGADVTPAAGVDMSDIASPFVQPVAFLTKHDGAGVGTMNVDYIKVWQAER
jgi:hypothetical protein